MILDEEEGRKTAEGEIVNRKGDEECKEVAVVSPTNAVVHPRAVVVESLEKIISY